MKRNERGRLFLVYREELVKAGCGGWLVDGGWGRPFIYISRVV
jgi:hypothetical protein